MRNSRLLQANMLFNEAGAINPGKPGVSVETRKQIGLFNEAGAINPGKPAQVVEIDCQIPDLQ